MARYVFHGTARDGAGNVVTSATVSVYLAGTSTAASIYTASSGGTATSSVTSSSTDGTFYFYVDTSDYNGTQKFKLSITKTGYTTKTYDDVSVLPSAYSLVTYSVTGTYKNMVIKNNATNPTYQIDIDADEIILSDTSYTMYRSTSVNLTVDLTASGANGLDTGTEATSTWYHLWVISDGTTTAGLMSTSTTSPTMPSSYTYKAYVGACYNAAGGDLTTFKQYNNRVEISTFNAVISGTDLTYTATTLTYVPTTAKVARGVARIVVATGTDARVYIASDNGTYPSGERYFETYNLGHVGSMSAEWSMLLSTARTIYYKVYSVTGTGTADITVSGYEF